jgi:hypothetical protein
MFKKLCICCLFLSVSAVARADLYSIFIDQGIYAPGPYVSARFGWGFIDLGDNNFDRFLKDQNLGKVSADRDLFTSNFILGWSFFRFFSIEAGYIDYPNLEYELNIPDETSDGTEYRYLFETKAWDGAAKVSLPLTFIPFLKRFDLYGKFGYAYTSSDLAQYINDTEITHNTVFAWLPMYEAGITFNFNKFFFADASWTRINGKNRITYGIDTNNQIHISNDKVTPTTDFFAIGVSFKLANLI